MYDKSSSQAQDNSNYPTLVDYPMRLDNTHSCEHIHVYMYLHIMNIRYMYVYVCAHTSSKVMETTPRNRHTRKTQQQPNVGRLSHEARLYLKANR